MVTIFNEKEWETVNKLYLQDTIKDSILKRIRGEEIELPYPRTDLTEAYKDFKKLQELDTTPLWKQGDFYFKYNYKYPNGDTFIDAPTTGNKASNYFHQENRMKCDSLNSPSPYRVWSTDKFMKTLFGAGLSVKLTTRRSPGFNVTFLSSGTP